MAFVNIFRLQFYPQNETHYLHPRSAGRGIDRQLQNTEEATAIHRASTACATYKRLTLEFSFCRSAEAEWYFMACKISL